MNAVGEHPRLCREVRAPEGSRVGHGRPASGLRAARLYRDDGLVLRCLARDPDEVPRVAEVLDVREDQFRVRVSVPHPKEIVEAHLGLVPQRAELREADARGFGGGKDGDAEGAARCGQRDPARERRRRRERRIHADVGVGVDHAHAVRADHRHVVRVAHREESRLAGHSDLPDFSEAGGDHDEPFHSLLPAVLDGFECDLCGYRDDREIHSVGDLEDARIRPDPVDARHLRVHRVDRPLVIVHDEIVEDFVADLSSMRSVAVVLVLLGSVGAVLLVTAPTASATVYFRGIISVPTTWGGGAETNYVATGPITIRPSGSLTIMPGTIVRFEPGVHLFVEGRLTPDGPSAKAITSPANNTASPFPWGGIQFNASSSGSISWSTFDRVDRALTATDSSPDVTRNTVLQAGVGFAFVRSSSFGYSKTIQRAANVGGDAKPSDVRIAYNSINGTAVGIQIEQPSFPTVSGNTITNVSSGFAMGILVTAGASASIDGNTIQGVRGFSGASGAVPGAPRRDGAIGAGIYVSGAPSASITSNTVDIISGGRGGDGQPNTGGAGGRGGNGGPAAGIVVVATPDATIQWNMITSVTRGSRGAR